MIPQRNIFERIHVWYHPEDVLAYVAMTTGWPVPIETDSTEIWDGGGASG